MPRTKEEYDLDKAFRELSKLSGKQEGYYNILLHINDMFSTMNYDEKERHRGVTEGMTEHINRLYSATQNEIDLLTGKIDKELRK